METGTIEHVLKIRNAMIGDLPRIVEMGRRFLLGGPYREHLKDSPEAAEAACKRIFDSPACFISIAEDEGRAVGVFAFVVFDHYFSGEKTAGELIWYLEPEYRHSWTGLQLWMEAEKRAREVGAVYMQVTAPDNHVAEIYKKRKYEQVEVMFQRKL